MLDNPRQFLNSLPNKPGIYEMYDALHQILYVGKAKNLKKRLSSYFHSLIDPKTKALMLQVKSIEIIITPNENASLLLENNLIKAKKPRYNILFKDDKSFPYILLSRHNYSRLSIHRGAINKIAGKYFGPFPDATAVNFVLNLLQKLFGIRTCKDSFMRNRSRPCMLHQIKLCLAPCVGYIDRTTYALQVKLIEQFLRNKSDHVVNQLTKLMDAASDKLAYEQAANYRDQIANIRKVQSEQAITRTDGNIDVMALAAKENNVCINVLFVRNGLLLGNKTYFPEGCDFISSKSEALTSFIMHYYLQNTANIVVPDRILLNIKLSNRLQITTIFCERFRRKVIISDHIQGVQKQLITLAEANANNSLKNRDKLAINYAERLLDFKNTFHLSSIPQRIECFDVSHTMGEAEVASCVVFNNDGPNKSNYRRFNIKKKGMGDDYGALREVLLRRYSNLKILPDVIIIDGGRGQLNVAIQALRTLQMQNVSIIAIAKGKVRRPGLEEIYMQGKKDSLVLSPHSPTLHLMQQIRDEAHRFAISDHRNRMIKSRCQSALENIPGIGKAKRTLLLKHFGGIIGLQSVGIDELAKVVGVGRNLAKRIYEYLHA
jgi:excinuclease ABC subunit C